MCQEERRMFRDDGRCWARKFVSFELRRESEFDVASLFIYCIVSRNRSLFKLATCDDNEARLVMCSVQLLLVVCRLANNLYSFFFRV